MGNSDARCAQENLEQETRRMAKKKQAKKKKVAPKGKNGGKAKSQAKPTGRQPAQAAAKKTPPAELAALKKPAAEAKAELDAAKKEAIGHLGIAFDLAYVAQVVDELEKSGDGFSGLLDDWQMGWPLLT